MLKYFGTIFSEDNGASFSRYATAFAILISCGCLIHTVLHSHAFPDAGQLLALGGFMTAPYAVNKGTAIFTRRGDGSGTLPSISASEDGGRRGIPSDERLVLGFIILALAIYALVHP